MTQTNGAERLNMDLVRVDPGVALKSVLRSPVAG